MLLKTANAIQDDELSTPQKKPLGYIDWDCPTSCNERVIMRASIHNRERIVRDQYVRIDDPMGSRTGFLGRIVAGPFFSPRGENAWLGIFTGDGYVRGDQPLRRDRIAGRIGGRPTTRKQESAGLAAPSCMS